MGASTSLLLVEKGAKVVIAGRTEATLSRVAQAAPKTMPVLAQTVDVSSRESLDRLFTWFDDSVGKLDVLVNAAGINIPNRSFNQLSKAVPSELGQLTKVNYFFLLDNNDFCAEVPTQVSPLLFPTRCPKSTRLTSHARNLALALSSTFRHL